MVPRIVFLCVLLSSAAPVRAFDLYIANASGILWTEDDGGGWNLVSGLSGPSGLAFDRNNYLYVSCTGDNTIRRYDDGGNGTIFTNTGLSGPKGIAFDSTGKLYVANEAGGSIMRFNADGTASLFASMSGPNGLAFDTDGDLFVSCTMQNTIYKITPDGSMSVFATSGLSLPNGLAFDADGNLYVANHNARNILRFDKNGNESVFATTRAPSESLAFNDGKLYVVCLGNQIMRYDSTGHGEQFVVSGLDQPDGIAFWPTPEPSEWLLLILGAGALAKCRRVHCSL